MGRGEQQGRRGACHSGVGVVRAGAGDASPTHCCSALRMDAAVCVGLLQRLSNALAAPAAAAAHRNTAPSCCSSLQGNAIGVGRGERLTSTVNACGICGDELKDMSHLGQEVRAGADCCQGQFCWQAQQRRAGKQT